VPGLGRERDNADCSPNTAGSAAVCAEFSAGIVGVWIAVEKNDQATSAEVKTMGVSRNA
jgi:hypothetical protein